MRKRSRYFKRRLRLRARARRPARKRVPFVFNVKKAKALFFNASVLGFIVLVALVAWQLFNPGLRVTASPETVAALRVPYKAIALLRAHAAKYDVPFAELFVLFCAENDFFPEKNVNYDLSGLERQYAEDFRAIKRKYNAKRLAPYTELFANVLDELVCFPVPDGWEVDTEASFMYGDSWDAGHQGADILDRENVRGRVPVVSMTDGVVQDAGYNDTWGYHVGITTRHGNYYLYAHLDSLAPGVAPGLALSSGQSLGRMGDSGGRDGQPVHLHVAVSPVSGIAKERLWLNPYPLLRYIENPAPF